MKRFLITLLVAFALPTSVNAEINSEIHNLCKDVKDYLGCVKAQNLEVKTSDKKVFGNKCPEGYAYMGQGICNIVRCEVEKNVYSNFFSNNDDLLAGKSNWKCKYHAWWGPGHLRVGSASVEIGNDPNCPRGEPAIGWNNTCEAPYITKTKKKKTTKEKKKPVNINCNSPVWKKKPICN